MKIKDYKDAQLHYTKDDRGDATGAFEMFVAEVPRSEMDNFNTPDLEQSPDSFLKPGETLEDFDVEFRRPNAEGGIQQLVQPNDDGSRPGYRGSGDREYLLQLVEEANKGFKLVKRKDLQVKAGYSKSTNITAKDIGLDTLEIKLQKAFDYVMGNPNRLVVDMFDPMSQVKELVGTTDAPGRYLKGYAPYEEARNLIKVLAIPKSKTKLRKAEGLTLGRLEFRIDNNIKGDVLFAPPKQVSAETKIMDIVDRHIKQGGTKIEWTIKPEITPGGSTSYSEARFKYNGKEYGIGKLINNAKNDPNFKEFFKAQREYKTINDKIVEHPKTGKKIRFGTLMKEVYGDSVVPYNVDHYKSILDEPFTSLRVLPRRINTAAGNILSFNEADITNPNLIGKYSEAGKEMQLKKIGYDYNQPIEDLIKAELKLAKDVLVDGRILRKPNEIIESIRSGENYKPDFYSKEAKPGKGFEKVIPDLTPKKANLLSQFCNRKKLQLAGSVQGLTCSMEEIQTNMKKQINEAAKVSKDGKIPKKFGKLRGFAKMFFGDIAIPLEYMFMAPDLAAGDVEGALRSSTAGLFGAGKVDLEKLPPGEGKKYIKHVNALTNFLNNYQSKLMAENRLEKLEIGDEGQTESTDKLAQAEKNMADIIKNYQGFGYTYAPGEKGLLEGKVEAQKLIRDKVTSDFDKKIDKGASTEFFKDSNKELLKENLRSLGGDPYKVTPINNLEDYIKNKGEATAGNTNILFNRLPYTLEQAEAYGVPQIFDTYAGGYAGVETPGSMEDGQVDMGTKDVRDAYSSLPINMASQLAALEKKEFEEGMLKRRLEQELFAGGGIAGLSGGDKSGPPPKSGPASQGLRSLYKNGNKL